MGMYEVCAKCGHVGRGYYVDKIFAVIASDGKEAAAKVRQFPRVKHHHKNAIRYVEEISNERFREINSINQADPYFRCQNIQEQRRSCTIEARRDDEIQGRKSRETRSRQKKPKQSVIRVSSASLIFYYYNEVSQAC